MDIQLLGQHLVMSKMCAATEAAELTCNLLHIRGSSKESSCHTENVTSSTLRSGINVGSTIRVGVGRFGKNNKRRVWNNSRGRKIFFTRKGQVLFF